MRILGKGKTALAIQKLYSDAVLYDDSDISLYDKDSSQITVVSPGIPPSSNLVKNTKNLVSDYDLCSKEMPFSIWISGTNGKTTTTQMLQHLLESKNSQCGGNIGFPVCSMDKNKKIWILETSSFTLHYTNQAKPNIYVLLPISDDHLSWHGSFKEYEKAKLKPLDLMNKDDIAIVPKKYISYKTDAKMIFYESTEDLAKYFHINLEYIDFKEPFLMDAVLSLSVEKIITDQISYNLLNEFVQDHHKLEEFQDKKQRIWVDDSKATNLDATINALKSYPNKSIYLILGGDDKEADLNPLFKELQKYNVKLFAIGKNSDKLMNLSKEYSVELVQCHSLKVAVETISSLYLDKNNSVSILSPAAASLDQFSSYKERGEKFKEFVNSL